ncbi:MAG: LysE family translocator [Sedimenticola sp.]
MEFQNWLLFVSIAFIATVTPGPAVLLATSHSAAYGWKHSIVTILGNISGLFVMSALSVLGLSAVILNSAVIFEAVKIAGAAYLVYLGVKIWRSGFVVDPGIEAQEIPQRSWKKGYVQGLVVALSNPKAIAFTTALFPQFIDHDGSLLVQFSLLIATFMFLSFSCLVGYALAVEHAKNRLFSGIPRFLGKLFGVAFIASGIVLANATRDHA